MAAGLQDVSQLAVVRKVSFVPIRSITRNQYKSRHRCLLRNHAALSHARRALPRYALYARSVCTNTMQSVKQKYPLPSYSPSRTLSSAASPRCSVTRVLPNSASTNGETSLIVPRMGTYVPNLGTFDLC